jgi:glucosamine--fructose-6-phosphate aminotransferase (isomerizing)
MSGLEPSPRPEWLTAAYPELRERPPWVMSEMVLAQRGLAGPIFAHAAAAELAGAVREALGAGGIVVTGCGTSEHAAFAVAALITDALGDAPGAVAAVQAFDAALSPRRGGLCIAISHGGTSTATVAALEAARQAGARTCLITAAEASDAHAAADIVFPTPLQDASWCHTVGYLSPVLAGAAVACELGGGRLDPDAVSTYIGDCDSAFKPRAKLAEQLAAMERLLAVGSGLDAITAAEQALKIEEGAWIPSTNLHLETLLHGHLPAADATTGLIAYLLDPHGAAQRAGRTRQALQAARAVGISSLLIASPGAAAELDDPAVAEGCVVLPASPLEGRLGALLGGAIALQRITLALSEWRGTNPDLLRRDDPRYRSAALLGAHKLRMFGSTP